MAEEEPPDVEQFVSDQVNSRNGEECRRTPSNSTSITRRRYLVAGAALAVAGCVGGDDDTPDDESSSSEDDGATGDADDSANDPDDDSDGKSEETLDVREDFDSYKLDIETAYEGPDGEWTQRLYREANVVDDQIYQQLEMAGDEGEPGTFEHYIVDGKAYQILPDGTCTPSNEAAILLHGANPGGFGQLHPDTVDTDADHITYEDTTTVAWVDEPVHVWTFDLEPISEAIDGMMQMYVGADSGYFVGYEGWYTTGAHDNPAEISIKYHRHSFNQDFEIELPGKCTDE